MFNKKNNKIKTESEYVGFAKLHTMKDDLSAENKKNREDINAEVKVEKNINVVGNSPFLNNTERVLDKKESNLDLQKETSGQDNRQFEVPKSSGFPQMPKQNQDSSFSNSNENIVSEDFTGKSEKKSFLAYVIIFIVILLLGAIGYYVWMAKGQKNMADFGSDASKDSSEESAIPSNENSNGNYSGAINDLSDNNEEFSEKVNFMIISKENLNQAGITKSIESKFIEMEKYSGNQLEFLIVDENNKPILFKDFIDSFKVTLDSGTMSGLSEDNFSLFLYKNKEIKRVGMVVGVKNRDALRKNLAANEVSLIDNMNSLFVYNKPDHSLNKKFNESEYDGNIIRYVNLNKNANLSLDYSIIGDYLIFATSKDSGRLIIDKLSDESEPRIDIFTPEN
ncbi:MAG: hypothetical protein UR60_C0010G0015 [Candidatus Moranbacteria bacterium GW2011_GWF2_34_56]|nr:MAG: hypothetical protein UR51_C0001G0038 [Candidatus Moranbacteria bacterium GW2011_GWF1_34_10]KKP65026.1 MAG: hypothetical protein UR60_C0010G0015 [Candidatus Moranbacteria bacterium GW2011_GWF2_34_56]HBI16936.1 hypothetical protein [Candidatus Moranbacteria bacterium]